MAQRVFITGIGIVSSMGIGIDAGMVFARKSKSPVASPTILKTLLADSFPLAEVRFTNDELENILKIRSKESFSRTALLAMLAAKEAFQMADLKPGKETAFISGTSVGGMDKGENLYNGYFNHKGQPNLRDAFVHDCGQSTQATAKYLGINNGRTATISTACSSAANSIMYAGRLIASGKIKNAVAGGTDALTRFTVNGFRSLLILSDELCKPFDSTRKGLNLGEGAGYVALESESELEKSGKTPLCELTGYANTCDAYHQTASSPDGNGAWLAVSQALKKAGLQPSEISYINAHGTATPNNDLSEGIALKRVFGEKLPPFSSTKALTGHTLGAAGGIEAVLSVLSIKHGILFPNLHFENIIPEIGQEPVTEWIEGVQVKNVLSNSFGFGGNNTSLVFSAC